MSDEFRVPGLVEIARLPSPKVYEAVRSKPSGLTTQEIQRRLNQFGKNAIREGKRTPLIVRFLANFVHVMALLLWAGGAMAFIAQMPQLGWAVWAVILINAVFSFWQEFKAEKATEALKKLLPSYARVLRDGAEARVLAEDLVPGDVLLVAEGDNIPADGRFVEEIEVRTNNATLTGESAPVRKTAEMIDDPALIVTELRNLAFAGTSVVSGTGKIVIVGTGMETQFGKIAGLTQAIHAELSPLQKEMARITRLITIVSVGLGVLFFLLGTLIAHLNLVAAFIFAIGVIVANVPEGLLPTVTLSLAMGVQRMVKRNALIKKLSSVETLGCTTVICTDKTGTLTQNAMTVREAWTLSGHVHISGNGYEPKGQFTDATGQIVDPRTGDLSELLRAGLLCNNAKLLPPDEADKKWIVLGDPTEAALIVAAEKAGITLDAERPRYPRAYELPFESRRKRMTTFHQQGKRFLAYVKGAPNEVLSACTHVLISGAVEPMTDAYRQRISAANDDFARGALRVLAVARREFERRPATLDVPTVEQQLTFIGLMAMMDPPRPEVAEAVQRCRSAGIRTIMITGDYGLTAESIARRIGMVSSAEVRIITGADLESMDDKTLKSALDGEVIFARVAPEHKLRVVSALQEKGHIVAVTGDGVNDAPALKKADIGVAMGLTGTDVAKEAASMILTDDNFASIVNAVEEGRAVYDNIKKFVTYVLASNVPELIPFIAMVLFNLPLGLTVMQVLAIDLGTDMFPALALGVEKPEHNVMGRPPRPRSERLLNRNLMFRAYIWLGSIESILAYVGFAALFAVANVNPLNMYVACSTLSGEALRICQESGIGGQVRVDMLPYADRMASDLGILYVMATTVFHLGVVASQIGNAFACRTEKSSVFAEQGIGAGFRWMFSNRFLLWGILIEIITMLIMVYVPPFREAFDHAAISPLWWAFMCIFPPTLFLLEEGRKFVVRRRERGHSRPGSGRTPQKATSVAKE